MDAMDIIIAADGIREEDILDAEMAAGLWPEQVIPIKKKRPAWRTALYVLLPAAAGIVLIIGVLGNMRMGSSAPADGEHFAAEATAEATAEAAGNTTGGAYSGLEEKTEAAEAAVTEENARPEEEPAEADAVTTEGAAAETARMVFVDGKLYIEEGLADSLKCGSYIFADGKLYIEEGSLDSTKSDTYDFTFETVVPESEEPTEELSSNFEAEGGVYLDEGRIAVCADGTWYVFILKE